MKAYIGKDIVIEESTSKFRSLASNMLTFNNPEYDRKLKMGKWLGDTPAKLSMLQVIGDKIILPFGMFSEVLKHKDDFESINCDFRDSGVTVNYYSKIKPYDYQEKAIQEALKAKQGIIIAPCGAGKTQIGLEIVARLSKRALWITHTSDLLNQSLERAKANFEIDDFGIITAGKVQIGQSITFATVQTLSKIDMSSFYDYFDVIIVDECHHAVGTPTKAMMFYRVLSSLNARYKFGLTATPSRSDGLVDSMFRLIGPAVCEIDKKEVAKATCPVNVIVKKTEYRPNPDNVLMPDGTLSYTKLINDITKDSYRNEIILNDVILAEGTCLVLTDRIEHAEFFEAQLNELGIAAMRLCAATNKKKRKDIIHMLNSGEIKVLIATYHLAKEGLDVPSLNNIFFATPQKNDTIVTQSAGRVGRKSEGKTHGTVYDYVDNFSMLVRWQKKRNSIYKKLDFSIDYPTF